MVENMSMLGGEHSFFADCSFNHDQTKNQKDVTKNSSNPEKIYETLNSEIKKVTENLKDLSELSNSNSQQCNEPFIDMKIWKNNKADATQVTDAKYYNKFEELKAQSQKKNNDLQLHRKCLNDNSGIEEDYEEVDEDNGYSIEINKIASININPTTFSHSLSLEEHNSGYKCITEPDECYFSPPLFSESNMQYGSNRRGIALIDTRHSNPYLNYHIPSVLGGNTGNGGGDINSFNSTQYSSNKVYHTNNYNSNSNEDFSNLDEWGNDNLDSNMNYNSYVDYRARVPTSESIESNKSARLNNNKCEVNLSNQLKYSTNANIPSMSSSNDDFTHLRKMNTTSINEGYLNAFKKRKMLSFCQSTYQSINPKGKIMINSINQDAMPKPNSTGFSVLKGEKQLINLDNIANGQDTRTTIMIRNIPIKYSDQMLFKELSSFEGKFDCVYMPFDFEKGGNKGYAFINFIHPYHILSFYQKFQSKKWEFFESKKICELNMANFQGIAEIQKHAKNYKGVKKPTFFKDLDPMKSLDVPSKYLMKIKRLYPKMTYIQKKKLGIVTIKSFC